ncbi:MAG: Ig-like domain-containing protein [Bacteroidota bacterium]
MFKRIVSISLLALLSACAQVGVLTGGGKDAKAPLLLKSSPSHAAINANPARLVLSFDEFIELVNPTETFRLEPSDAKLSVALHKTDVIISLKGILKSNTTYSLCIDGGIKDVTEGNDSIYRIAFSTGASLDSLTQHYRVGDAYTKKSMQVVSIGLFATDTSQKARYLTKSNKEGWASLDFLPRDSFYLKAFLDLNKNGMIDSFEPQDQLSYPVIPHSDSLAFLLSVPRDTQRSFTFKVKPPGLVVGHLPEEIDVQDLRLNGVQPRCIRLDRDSVMIEVPLKEAGLLTLGTPFDTLKLIYTEKDLNSPLKGEMLPLAFGNPLHVYWNGFLANPIDITKIRLMRQDSSSVLLDSAVVEDNALLLYSHSWSRGKLKAVFAPGAVQTSIGQKNGKQTLDFSYAGQEDLGVLMVRFPSSLGGQRVILEKEGRLIQSHYYLKESNLMQDIYRNLPPGEYHIVVVDDLNGNGFWDAYRPLTKEPAEPVRRYNKVPKVRANWELEVNLE